MINKNILCTVCARKGSKGLKDKNFTSLLGKPLIDHTVDQAQKIRSFKKIIISSNSNKISNNCKRKVDFLIKRPEKFSNDSASKIEAIRHALINSEKKFKMKFDMIVDLDVTSPLRSINDIHKALELFKKKNPSNLVSGYDARRNPYFNQVTYNKKKLRLVCKSKKNIVRRQDAPKIYDLNASIYIWSRKNLLSSSKLISKKTILFKMPYSRSIDIDDKFDFIIVKHILKNNLNK
jgi:CMP-N,N'-diacetyllegionaminic acid synthase